MSDVCPVCHNDVMAKDQATHPCVTKDGHNPFMSAVLWERYVPPSDYGEWIKEYMTDPRKV